MNLEKDVYDYQTKNVQGFTRGEILNILKKYPKINKKKFWSALDGITGMVKNKEFITYYCDILKALVCGLENRDLTLEEWD